MKRIAGSWSWGRVARGVDFVALSWIVKNSGVKMGSGIDSMFEVFCRVPLWVVWAILFDSWVWKM